MPKILIVDDDADIRDWTASVLQDADYDVEHMSDAQGVLSTLALGYVDLALIDHHMPGKSGLNLIRDIRDQGHTTPLILVTADHSQQLAVEGFRAGASDFIAKPIDPDYLKLVIQRTLANHSSSLRNAAYRSLGYARHKPECRFQTDGQNCDCGLKELFEVIQEF